MNRSVVNVAERKSAKPKDSLQEEDNIYYNVRVYAPVPDSKVTPPPTIVAKFSENRTVPILDKPSDYELAVERFSIPATNIPIMFWVDDKYQIVLSFDGYDAVAPLQYVPNTLPGSELYGVGNNAVWTYGEIIESINTAFQTAFDELKTAKPAAPPTQAPFVVIDTVTELMTLYAQTAYDSNGPATIEIWFNDPLTIITNWRTYYNPDPLVPAKVFNIIINDTKTNTITYAATPYYTFVQDYSSLALLNDIQGIVFETDRIPVEPEFQPGQKNITRQIVTDFEPLTAANSHDSYQFYAQGPLRYYDLKSEYPLTAIDIRVSWQAKDGRLWPIYLAGGDLLTVKLQFRKKRVGIFTSLLSDGFG